MEVRGERPKDGSVTYPLCSWALSWGFKEGNKTPQGMKPSPPFASPWHPTPTPPGSENLVLADLEQNGNLRTPCVCYITYRAFCREVLTFDFSPNDYVQGEWPRKKE